MELALPSLATGAVDRVWYSPDGSSLYAKTASGRVFQTADFEQWQLVTDPKVSPPPEDEARLRPAIPEAGFKLANGGAQRDGFTEWDGTSTVRTMAESRGSI